MNGDGCRAAAAWARTALGGLPALAAVAPGAAAGEWTGTIIDRQVIDQSDGRHTETYTNHWTIGVDSSSYTFSLTGVTKYPDGPGFGPDSGGRRQR